MTVHSGPDRWIVLVGLELLLVDQFFEFGHELGGNRPNVTAGDGSTVDGHDRDDFGGAPRQEAFVRHKQIMPGESYFFGWNAEFFRQLQDGVASDSLQNARVFGRCL